MLKRALSLLMAICITMTLFPVAVVNADDSAAVTQELSVTADEAPGGQPVIHYADDIQLVNPLDGGVYSFDIVPDESESGTIVQPVDEASYLTESKAARKICNSMEARDTSFTVYVKSKKNYQSCFDTIWKNAFNHTGVPTEGDSLLWCWNSCSAPTSYYYKSGYYYLTYKFKVTYKTNATQEATLAKKIDQLLEQLDLWENTDYQKVQGVYDYMCANIRYDYDNLYDSSYKIKHTAYAALIHKTAVCSGYAWLFYQLMLELGLDCRCISGSTTPGGPVSEHAWNIVKLDGKYYHLDSTWDENVPPSSYRYFLTSPGTFGKNHYRDSQYTTSSFTSAYPVASGAYTPTISSYLKITTQPVDTTVKEGSTFKLTVSAKGESPQYWWYMYNSSTGYYDYTGVSSKTFSGTMSANLDGRWLACLVKDAYGNELWSDVIYLSMATPLKITKQPTSVKVPNGATAKVSVSATGDGLKYVWYYKNSGSSSYSKSSVTTPTYSVTMNSSRSGRKVYCVITDQYGDKIKTNTVSLNKKASPVITKQPTSVKVPSGYLAETSVEATGEGLTYQWYYRNSGSSTYKKASITGSTYSVEMSSSRSGRKIYCVITDKYGNKTRSNTVTLSRAATAKITKQPSSVKVASGSKAKVTLTATGTGLTYEWYYRDPGQESFLKSSASKATYSCTMSRAKSGRELYCVVTDKFGNSVQSRTVTLKVK